MKLSQRIGVVFRKRRHALSLTQTDLAGIADSDRSFISNVENGKKNISIDTFARFCKALETKPSDILLEAERHWKE